MHWKSSTRKNQPTPQLSDRQHALAAEMVSCPEIKYAITLSSFPLDLAVVTCIVRSRNIYIAVF
jgi:hypothetical protein